MTHLDLLNKRSWRKIHRWIGLVVAGLVIFYCLTGILLNHRRYFAFFIAKDVTVSSVPTSDTSVMRTFIDMYKKQINRMDDPTVIRIRGDESIEFLYGSHGKTTYIIHPRDGRMLRIDKRYRQPWTWLNNLHKAFKTHMAWVVLSDVFCAMLLLVIFSGLTLPRYRPLDWCLLAGGLLIMLFTMLGP